MNVAAILGRLTADPELRKTPSGISTTHFTVAVPRSYVKQGEERQTDFIDCTAWRSNAEFVCKYFKKGQMIAVQGSIQTRNYEDKQGNKRKGVEISIDNVSFADSKGSAGSTPGAPAMHSASPSATPDYNSAPAQKAEPAFSQGSDEDFVAVDDNSDLPF